MASNANKNKEQSTEPKDGSYEQFKKLFPNKQTDRVRYLIGGMTGSSPENFLYSHGWMLAACYHAYQVGRNSTGDTDTDHKLILGAIELMGNDVQNPH